MTPSKIAELRRILQNRVLLIAHSALVAPTRKPATEAPVPEQR